MIVCPCLCRNTSDIKMRRWLRRGLYGTPIKAHPSQSPFVRCDGAIFRYAYDPALIGKTIFMKFPAFNQFGGGGQSLADAAEYVFRIAGN